MRIVDERVQRGLKLLTDNFCDFSVIDIDTLDMSSEYSCVLGQLYGTYYEGTRRLGIRAVDGYDYGFSPFSWEEDDLNYAWRVALTRVRG